MKDYVKIYKLMKSPTTSALAVGVFNRYKTHIAQSLGCGPTLAEIIMRLKARQLVDSDNRIGCQSIKELIGGKQFDQDPDISQLQSILSTIRTKSKHYKEITPTVDSPEDSSGTGEYKSMTQQQTQQKELVSGKYKFYSRKSNQNIRIIYNPYGRAIGRYDKVRSLSELHRIINVEIKDQETRKNGESDKQDSTSKQDISFYGNGNRKSSKTLQGRRSRNKWK